MIAIVTVLGIAFVVGLAVIIWWRRTAPGKRLRFGAFTLYYTRAVRTDEANRAAQYLKRQNFADHRMDARLTRHGATCQLQLICSGQPVERQLLACEVLAAGLSDDVFAGAMVEVQVCDPIFRPFVVIPHQRRFGRRIAMNSANLFYLEGVTDAEAFDIATFLAGVGVFDDSPKIAQMNRNGDGYEFRLAVDVALLTPEMVEGECRMASDLSRVLKGALVAVHFCSLSNTLRAGKWQIADLGPASSLIPRGPYRTEVFLVPGRRSEETDREDRRG